MCICLHLCMCVCASIHINTYTNPYMTCAPMPGVVVFLSLSTDIRLPLSMGAYHCFMSCYLFRALYVFCTARRILAHRQMFFVLHTTRNKAFPILSYLSLAPQKERQLQPLCWHNSPVIICCQDHTDWTDNIECGKYTTGCVHQLFMKYANVHNDTSEMHMSYCFKYVYSHVFNHQLHA